MDEDRESAAWIRELTASGAGQEAAARRLHDLLLRVARAECARRMATIPERGRDEIDHLAVQATNDAMLAVLRKLSDFRGTARFTTWACKFVILEVSTRLRRLAWRERRIESDDTVWDHLSASAQQPLAGLETAELMAAVREAIRNELTERQRLVLQAVIMDEVPIDVLAERLESSRGAVYKALHDARTRLRRVMVTAGYGEHLP